MRIGELQLPYSHVMFDDFVERLGASIVKIGCVLPEAIVQDEFEKIEVVLVHLESKAERASGWIFVSTT